MKEAINRMKSTNSSNNPDSWVKPSSKEGLMVNLDASVIYSVREDMASEIKQTVTGDIRDTLLIPYLRIVSGSA